MIMSNDIKSILFGSGLIVLSFLLFVFRNRLSRNPPNKNKLAYFTEEQTKSKIYIACVGFLLAGIWVIYYTLSH